MAAPLASATALPTTLVTLVSIFLRQVNSTTLTPTPTSFTSTFSDLTTTTTSASSTLSVAQECTRCAKFVVPIFFFALFLAFIGLYVLYLLGYISLQAGKLLFRFLEWFFKALFDGIGSLCKWTHGGAVKKRKEWGDWRVKKRKERVDERDRKRKVREEKEAVELERKRGFGGVEAII